MVFRATRTRHAATETSKAATLRLETLQAETRKLAELAVKAENGINDWTRKLEELRKRSAPPTSGPKPPGLFQLLEFDPSLKPAWDKRVRAKTEDAWEPMLLELKFEGKDREDFLESALEDSDRNGDIVQSAEAQGLALDHPAIEALFEAERARTRAAWAARFGEERANRINDFWRTMGARQFANALAERVAFTEPLTADQASRMTQIVAEATPKYVSGGFAYNEKVDWAVVDRRMREVLSAGQLEAWTRAGLRDPQGYRSREELAMEALYERVIAEEKRGGSANMR